MENKEIVPTIKLRVVRGVSGELYIVRIYGMAYEDAPDILDSSGDCLSDLLYDDDLEKFPDDETFFEVELIVRDGGFEASGELLEEWIDVISVTPLKVEFKPIK